MPSSLPIWPFVLASATSLTIYNAASSPKTLKIMLIIAGCGMPLVLAYTASIYWIFRGKVKLDSGKRGLKVQCVESSKGGRILMGLDCFAFE